MISRDLRGATAEAIDKPVPKAKARLAALMTVRICIVSFAGLLDGQIGWPGLNKPTVLDELALLPEAEFERAM